MWAGAGVGGRYYARTVRSRPNLRASNNHVPASRLGDRKNRDIAGTIIIEVFNAPFSGACAVFDDGDILLKRVAHQQVLESLSGSKPLPLGGSLGGYDFPETSRLVRHCCALSPSSTTGCWLGSSEPSPNDSMLF